MTVRVRVSADKQFSILKSRATPCFVRGKQRSVECGTTGTSILSPSLFSLLEGDYEAKYAEK